MPGNIIPIPGFNEPFSSLSHYLGGAVFAVLGVMLVARGRGDRLRAASLVLYVLALLFLMAMSGTFHLVRRGTTAHEVMGRLDYAAIYLLIAGTYTPPHVILFRGWARWGPLALIWAIAIVGVTFKTVFYDELTHGLSVAIYIAMGWIGVFGAAAIWRRYGLEFVKPLVAGGLAYTIGALCEVQGKSLAVWPGVIGSHEVWHVAVLFGAAFHWAFIYQFAAGAPPSFTDLAERTRTRGRHATAHPPPRPTATSQPAETPAGEA